MAHSPPPLPDDAPTLTLRELEQMRCDNPECSHSGADFIVSAACCGTTSVNVRYFDGKAHVTCAKCQTPVVKLAIAANKGN